MIPDDLRQRLLAQRSGALRAVGAGYVDSTVATAHSEAVGAAAEHGDPDAPLPGALEIETPYGPHLTLRVALDEWLKAGRGAIFVGAARKPSPTIRPAPPAARLELLLWRHTPPEQRALLDLETCGFAGSPIFLVGLTHFEHGRWVVEQLLARHYGEERAILATLWQRLCGKEVLATFNGKSFDWPMVCDRSEFHHLTPGGSTEREAASPAVGPAAHLDVLHHARRHWGNVAPNCKLQTLERCLCGRVRRGDLPGREAPAAYHQFVRDGNPRRLRAIVHHNAWDLITLWELAQALTATLDGPHVAAPQVQVA